MEARTGPLLSNAATSLAAIAFALLLAEGAVRLVWRDAPETAAPDTLPIEKVRDPEILYRLVPGASGRFNGTTIRINSLGLRDRDFAIPAPAGTRRILVLGDSMVFGVGLPPEETLPGQLGRLLDPVEVINGGVFGYNLGQEIALLRDVGLRYRPDLVVSCFVHNDIENWGVGEGGAVPEIRSSRFDPPPRSAWSTRLADLMLPGTFDPDRLNLLPRADAAGGLRAHLASMSRLYLFVYLRLRTHSWNLTGGERRDPLVDSPACEADEVIWGPLREKYRSMKRLTDMAGARLLVVIEGGLLWEGRPLARLRSLLAEEKIPFLDLTPVWRDADFYAREYSLGWDPHPNARANRVAAELVADYLRHSSLLPGSLPAYPIRPAQAAARAEAADADAVIAARDDLKGRLAEWRERQRRLDAQEEADWESLSRRFSPDIVFEGGEAKAADPAQILYGFWEPAGGRPQPGAAAGEAGGGWWMSKQAAVLLRPQAGARHLSIDLVLPEGALALEHTPRSLQVSLGSPPRECALEHLDLPVDFGRPGSVTKLEVELPEHLRGAGAVEVGLSVDRGFAASYLDPARKDPRLVSFLIRRIALQ